MPKLPFVNRTDAGSQLSELLREHTHAPDTLLLALVRGGVEIGRALVDRLSLPLFPYVVRKLGHPGNPEYAMGAIAEGGATHMDDAAMRMTGMTWEDMEPIIDAERKEMERRREAYMTEARPDLAGKTVILTDDGAATGATMLAAIRDVRAHGAARVIVALPVCPPETAQALREEADDAVVLATPPSFSAVGQFYHDFPQLADEDVLRLLQQ